MRDSATPLPGRLGLKWRKIAACRMFGRYVCTIKVDHLPHGIPTRRTGDASGSPIPSSALCDRGDRMSNVKCFQNDLADPQRRREGSFDVFRPSVSLHMVGQDCYRDYRGGFLHLRRQAQAAVVGNR